MYLQLKYLPKLISNDSLLPESAVTEKRRASLLAMLNGSF